MWGSQQDNLAPLSNHDGVIGMWYGKAPGVDRSGDAFRHANLHGVGTNGGVVCAVGDDPQSKSSTLPGASEVALYDAGMPVLVPGTPQEVLDLGRHAYELSRYTGCWTGLKIVTSVADGFGSADVAPGRIAPVLPELSFGGEAWRHVQRPTFFLPHTVELEAELYERRHAAARAYAAANGLNAVEVDAPGRLADHPVRGPHLPGGPPGARRPGAGPRRRAARRRDPAGPAGHDLPAGARHRPGRRPGCGGDLRR